MSDSAAYAADRHPHEPEIPPAWNEEGRCLVCGLGALIDELLARKEILRDALEDIAAPRRPDGTYNLSREACEERAVAALVREEDFTNQTVTKSADSSITRERPRDAGTSGAAT